MALPTGLLPVFAFVLTAGVATLVTLGAHLLWAAGDRPFAAALRGALAGVSLLYLAGAFVVWYLGGAGALWGVVTALAVAGLAAFGVLWVLPLLVGRTLVQRSRNADPETALRATTYGWPVAMLVVFGVFVAPGGLTGGHLFHLAGPQTCLLGFCGVSVALAGAVVVELLVAVFGPGLLGRALYSTVAAESSSSERLVR